MQTKVAETAADVRVRGGGLAGELLLGEGGEAEGERGLVGHGGPAFICGGWGGIRFWNDFLDGHDI